MSRTTEGECRYGSVQAKQGTERLHVQVTAVTIDAFATCLKQKYHGWYTLSTLVPTYSLCVYIC